jgi:hypothetical protein
MACNAPRSTRYLHPRDVRRVLRAAVRRAGGVCAWSARHRLSHSTIYVVLRYAHTSIPPAVIRALGMKQLTFYVRK